MLRLFTWDAFDPGLDHERAPFYFNFKLRERGLEISQRNATSKTNDAFDPIIWSGIAVRHSEMFSSAAADVSLRLEASSCDSTSQTPSTRSRAACGFLTQGSASRENGIWCALYRGVVRMHAGSHQSLRVYFPAYLVLFSPFSRGGSCPVVARNTWHSAGLFCRRELPFERALFPLVALGSADQAQREAYDGRQVFAAARGRSVGRVSGTCDLFRN